MLRVLRRQSLAVMVLIVGCLLSAAMSTFLKRTNEQVEAIRFKHETDLATRFISARIERYVNAMIHTKALFAVERRISREQFRKYIDDLDVFQKYPGTLGIGYAARAGAEPFSFRILSIEPENRLNRGLLGGELASGSVRRGTLELAARVGQPTASPRIAEITAKPELGPGFLLVNPVYQQGMPAETADQRQYALRGFVFSVFQASSFFEELFQQKPISHTIDLAVYDGSVLSPQTLLFTLGASIQKKGSEPRFETVRHIQMAGRTWSLDFQARPQFVAALGRRGPWILFAIGVLISYLVAQILWSMQERVESERNLAMQIRQAVVSRDEFISIASHELKTPITSLKLQLALARAHPEKSPALIGAAERQVMRLNGLIDELLDMTRIQTGKLRYGFERTDLVELIREITERYKAALEQAGCELTLTAPPSLVAEVDRFRIEQVLVNLLTNAMKYARGKPVEVWIEQEASKALIRVVDHGAGIPAEKRELVFKRFERIDEGDTVGGLGLGLYISRQIVEHHGGRIWVESELGQGSIFNIELPLSR